jgi:superfamily II DNA helicase RecQ
MPRALPTMPRVLQISASATMSPKLLEDLRAMLRVKQRIALVMPDDDSPAGPAGPPTDGSSQQTLGGLEPAWGWGQDSGFWAGRAGAAATRGSAGGALPECASSSSMAPQLQHCFLTEVKRHHTDLLRRLLYALDARKMLVFMNHQDRLQDAVYKLQAKGVSAGALHGEMGKQRRQSVLQQFRNGTLRVLLVSDVVSRGLDVNDCDAVVNLEMPSNAAHYAHRAGRTGRMGRPGVVCSIVEKQHEFVVEKMSRALQIEISQGKASGGRATIIKDGTVIVLGRFYDEAETASEDIEESPESLEEGATVGQKTAE